MLDVNKIYFGDCLDVMKDIDDGSIDMILCDLPYGVTACKWDVIIDLDCLWKEYNRIIKDCGAIVLFGSQPFTSKLVMSNLKMFKYEWIWMKDKGANICILKYQPSKIHENILVFSKKSHNYYPVMEKRLDFNKRKNKKNFNFVGIQCSKQFLTIESKGNLDYKYPTSIKMFNSNRNGVHPTQKPVKLFEYLIKTYTLEKEVVLDNCIGSGTTAISCIRLNRRYIGIEKDQKYFDICCNRIIEYNRQKKLF